LADVNREASPALTSKAVVMQFLTTSPFTLNKICICESANFKTFFCFKITIRKKVVSFTVICDCMFWTDNPEFRASSKYALRKRQGLPTFNDCKSPTSTLYTNV
jgi:hypothetical protein